VLNATIKIKGKIDAEALKRAIDKWLPVATEAVHGQAVELAPVDTGNLKGSIAWRVEGKTGIVGTRVEYAPYQEYGTRKMQAQPFLRPALDKMRKKIALKLREMYDVEVKKDGPK
jgi:HK97 gp10 family phage protein